jgi:ribosomal protein S18 acetylase RimI-like enzyme
MRLMRRTTFYRQKIARSSRNLFEAFCRLRRCGLAVDEDDRPIAFMLVESGHMEALFVDPVHQGKGVGAALVRHGLALHPAMTTDVNEQNAQAVRFYERMGFHRIGRSSRDGQGRAYPLIHLAYRITRDVTCMVK